MFRNLKKNANNWKKLLTKTMINIKKKLIELEMNQIKKKFEKYLKIIVIFLKIIEIQILFNIQLKYKDHISKVKQKFKKLLREQQFEVRKKKFLKNCIF